MELCQEGVLQKTADRDRWLARADRWLARATYPYQLGSRLITTPIIVHPTVTYKCLAGAECSIAVCHAACNVEE